VSTRRWGVVDEDVAVLAALSEGGAAAAAYRDYGHDLAGSPAIPVTTVQSPDPTHHEDENYSCVQS